ncbi:hypothetical protein Taro_015167 [Colocasia esculenta]|uniref:Uncharacterized protein n=1 Tax=Colocasia esculenta TaxID=4460 RepID=A0A843UP20_COLES|nr:hypothetical protein [Colocasia esculenta]
MCCMAERMAQVGWNLGQLRRPGKTRLTSNDDAANQSRRPGVLPPTRKLASRGITANMKLVAVDAAVYMGSEASQQMVKRAVLDHGTTRGWAKSRVYESFAALPVTVGSSDRSRTSPLPHWR